MVFDVKRRSLTVLFMGLMLVIFIAEVIIALYNVPASQVTETKIGGDFTMVNHMGKVVTNRDYEGKPMVVFFGFTFCPDICPTTLNRLSSLLDKLGPDAEKVNVLFVSVDPERDTPKVLEQYLGSFHRRITGLTGSQEQLTAFAKSYKAYYKKVPAPDGTYTMDHTATIMMFDSHGKFAGILDRDGGEEVALQQLRKLIDV